MARQFNVRLLTDTEAFRPDPYPEIARILRNVADEVDRRAADMTTGQTIRDINDEIVGTFQLEGYTFHPFHIVEG